MDDRSYIGDTPHPGFYIREELEAREWSQRDLAYILGTPEQAVNMILSGKRGVSPEMAKALAEAFDVHPDLFANLQRAYDMARAREPDSAVGRRARLQSKYPIREMIRRGWLEDSDAAMLEMQMARFFGVSDIAEIPHMQHAAKKASAYYEETPPAQLAWLFRVRQIARTVVVGRYSERALRDALRLLQGLLVDPEEARHVPRILGECGVRLVFVESLPNAKIDGVCFWLDKSSPVIGLSLRFDRIDNFWFVLRHELEHVLRKDGQVREIIDVDVVMAGAGDLPPEEVAANDAAADFCVPKPEMDSFVARKASFFAERDVVGFARRLNIHPGLVVGQIQRRTQRWDFLRRHLVKVRAHVLPAAVVDGWGVAAPSI